MANSLLSTAPRLLATNLGRRGWKVEASEVVTETGHLTLNRETLTAQATFERYGDGGPQTVCEIYRAVDGTASWAHTGSEHGCTGSAQGSYPVAETSGQPGESPARILFDQYGVYWNGGYQYDGSRRYTAMAINSASVTTRITYTCVAGQTYEKNPLHFAWLNSGPASLNLMAAADGKTITGTDIETSTQSNGFTLTRHYSWKITALPPE